MCSRSCSAATATGSARVSTPSSTKAWTFRTPTWPGPWSNSAGSRRELDAFLGAFDGVITPPALGEAPADLTQTGDPAFCTIWSLCGVPAVTIPTGRGPAGLPLGLQVVGPRFADDRVLSVARWCDERSGGARGSSITVQGICEDESWDWPCRPTLTLPLRREGRPRAWRCGVIP